jgi:hypothetical protein
MIVTSFFIPARQLPTSIPMNELPTTTTFLPLSPTALRMFCASGSVRSRNTLPRSPLRPSSGSHLGVPPVASTSFVYSYDLPDLVDTFLLAKSTLCASSSTISIDASL